MSAVALQRKSSSAPPRDWRERTPDPRLYYRENLPGHSTESELGYVQAQCPFHADRNNSLSVHVSDRRGAWRCEHCGGGDLVGFHMRLRKVDFRAAVLELVRKPARE